MRPTGTPTAGSPTAGSPKARSRQEEQQLQYALGSFISKPIQKRGKHVTRRPQNTIQPAREMVSRQYGWDCVPQKGHWNVSSGGTSTGTLMMTTCGPVGVGLDGPGSKSDTSGSGSGGSHASVAGGGSRRIGGGSVQLLSCTGSGIQSLAPHLGQRPFPPACSSGAFSDLLQSGQAKRIMVEHPELRVTGRHKKTMPIGGQTGHSARAAPTATSQRNSLHSPNPTSQHRRCGRWQATT
jgi:hypothetical protein